MGVRRGRCHRRAAFLTPRRRRCFWRPSTCRARNRQASGRCPPCPPSPNPRVCWDALTIEAAVADLAPSSVVAESEPLASDPSTRGRRTASAAAHSAGPADATDDRPCFWTGVFGGEPEMALPSAVRGVGRRTRWPSHRESACRPGPRVTSATRRAPAPCPMDRRPPGPWVNCTRRPARPRSPGRARETRSARPRPQPAVAIGAGRRGVRPSGGGCRLGRLGEVRPR